MAWSETNATALSAACNGRVLGVNWVDVQVPVEPGSVTPSAAAIATAASAALPPACRMRKPASAASCWLQATMPRVPYTGERLAGQGTKRVSYSISVCII